MVTGAGSGIGRSIAMRFVEAGDTVYAVDIAQHRLDELRAATTGAVQAVVADVREHDVIAGLLADARSQTGRLDVVVNSAGVFDGYAGVRETTPELWNRIIEINLTGAFNVARAAALEMLDQRAGGRIIAVSSIGGTRASLDGLAYITSKAGIDHMVRRLAFELGRAGITVNAVAPGAITTNLRATSEEILGQHFNQSGGIGRAMTRETLDFALPAGRPGDVREVSAVVSFLASAEASYVNGQIIAVDGGWTAG